LRRCKAKAVWVFGFWGLGMLLKGKLRAHLADVCIAGADTSAFFVAICGLNCKSCLAFAG
jgi:hypothetical protein